MNCPKCEKEMEHQEHEPDTDISGGYFCEACDFFLADWEVDDEDPYF